MSETAIEAEVAVVGAGPAGLSAAVSGADSGLSIILIDASSRPGGQYWRHSSESFSKINEDPGHRGWKTFTHLRSRLYAHIEQGHILYLKDHQVWLIERIGTSSIMHLSPTYEAAPSIPTHVVKTDELILCPGAYDRQLPIPGWDMPGVMTAGGVQTLLKSNGSIAGTHAVVGGSGPFLLPVATEIARAGVKVSAICEANNPLRWLNNLNGVLQAPAKVLEAIEYASVLGRHRIPFLVRTAITAIHGDSKVQAVTLAKLDSKGMTITGTERQIEVDLVALGWGFTPSLELILAVGAETTKDVDGSLTAVVDDEMRSNVTGIRIAGEATGIGGAKLAALEGELAALSIARSRNGNYESARIRSLKRSVRRGRAFAIAMHNSNPIPECWHDWLTSETLICRCEEVSYAQICYAIDDLGADDPRSVKSFARPGMGWCQGRVCGFATTEIIAARLGRASTATEMRAMAGRLPATPLTLAQLAALEWDETESDKGA